MKHIAQRKVESKPIHEISLYLGITGLFAVANEINFNELDFTVSPSKFDDLSFTDWFSWN